MPDDAEATSGTTAVRNGEALKNGDSAEFAALRRLLLGPEQEKIDELATELKERKLTATELSEQLPEAIVIRNRRDTQIGLALAPTIETALRESVRRDPDDIAAAIFPVLGPAIRKAIAETMAALVRSINAAMDHAFTLRGIKWRIESWRTGVPYAEVVIKHALVYRVEQAFLIHAETGILLAHATCAGMTVPDAELISAMLSAINDFVHDAFRPGEGATLRTFTVGEHTVQVESGPLADLALVIRGESPVSVLRKQQQALETVHLQYANALAEFTGDTRPFHSAQPLLDGCLETVVNTGSARRNRFAWLRWAIPAAVLLFVVAALGRSRARFDRALTVLNDEPGLVVIDATQGWRSWFITGLRDPHARAPSTVLAGAGLAPRSLFGRWESYVSLDSDVVVERARQALGLRATQLALRGNTLLVAGDIPLDAIRRLQEGRLTAGVSDIEVGAVRITLPPYLDSLRTRLIGDRVLFAADHSRLTSEQVAAIRRNAEAFQALHDSVMANSGELVMVLLGRTDGTGSNERNASLAQWRINQVRAILAGAGVRPEHLREEALATARPLDAPDSTQRANINRSVSYDILVSARWR